MKKRVFAVLFMAVLLTSVCSGCGRKAEPDDQTADTDEVTQENTEDSFAENTGTEAAMDTENATSQLQLGSAVEIPASFDGQLAETDAHGQLEMVIAEYCNLAEDDYSAVRYYYNYVDLNGDGQNEILALVLGQDITGIDGNLLLWLEGEEDSVTADAVLQAFRQVGTPVYISNHMTNGYRDLIIPEHSDTVGAMAGAESGADSQADTGENQTPSQSDSNDADTMTSDRGQKYRLLLWTGEKYQELEEAAILESLDELEGMAVLTNNIESDFINDNYHFLGEGMRD